MELLAIETKRLAQIESDLSAIKHLLSTKTQPQDKKWLSKKETCSRLKVCGKTLESYFSKRLLPYAVNGSKKYVLETDLDAFLMSRYIKRA